jgi:hypothetical protein
MPSEVMHDERTATRGLPARAAEDDLALWPITDARLRTQGFLADVDVSAGLRPHRLAEALTRFSLRWRRLTGTAPELHLRITGLADPRDDDLAASLAPLRATGRVVVWRPSPGGAGGEGDGWRVDGAASARAGASGDGSLTRPLPRTVPRMLRADSVRTAPDGRAGSQVLLTGIDDPARLQAARRRRPWRLTGRAIGGPDTAEGWCWWAVGLGLGDQPAAKPRSRRAR